jgi:hypothetical protein
MKNILTRIVAVIVGLALFAGAFVFSVVFFAAAFTIAVLVWGYVLWKTRHLRRQVRQRVYEGDVIEGTVISSETLPPRRKGTGAE